MSEIKVNSIKGVGASSAAITVNNTNGTCTANITNNLSNRRLTINGDMSIAQRGTTFTDPTGSGTYTLDRFNFQNTSGTPAFTITQDTDAPHIFKNSLKVACTTADASPAAGSITRLRYKVEAQDLQPLAKGTSSAKASILSFYVKTNKTGVYTVFVYDDDNNRMFSASYTVSDTNWNRYTIVIPADTTGAINDDNGTGFVIHWGLSLGSDRTSGSLASTWATYSTANEHVGGVNFADNTSNVWAITGVQLEVDQTGSGVATDFEHLSFADELRRCQRYFFRTPAFGTGTTSIYLGSGVEAGSSARIAFIMPQVMRAAPTVTAGDLNSDDEQSTTDASTVSAIIAGSSNCDRMRIQLTGGSYNAGNAVSLVCANANGFLAGDAEL
jgi:hypothetical protein